jgi:hypothetical protein
MGLPSVNPEASARSYPLVGESPLIVKMPTQRKYFHVALSHKQFPHLGQPTKKKLCGSRAFPFMETQLEGYSPLISSLPFLP